MKFELEDLIGRARTDQELEAEREAMTPLMCGYVDKEDGTRIVMDNYSHGQREIWFPQDYNIYVEAYERCKDKALGCANWEELLPWESP